VSSQSTPKIIDTHVHFDDDRFDADRDNLYQQAVAAGVTGMIIPATTQRRWSKVQSVADHYDGAFPTFGLHPLFCDEHEQDHLTALQQQLHHGVAIGECGLDKQPHTSDLNKQRDLFEAQIEMAKSCNKPLIIHARNTVEEVLTRLKQAELNRSEGNGVVHSFNGSLVQAHRLLDMNFKVSFGGPVTRTNARKLHELVRRLPLDAMMIETDAPDQTGDLHRGQRNEPQWIVEVIGAIADIRNESECKVTMTSNRNAIKLFQLPAESSNTSTFSRCLFCSRVRVP